MEVRGTRGAAARGDGLGAGAPARADAGGLRRMVARGDPRRPRRRPRARVGVRGSGRRPAAGRAGRPRRTRPPGTRRHVAVACRRTARGRAPGPAARVAPSCCAVQAIVCSERHSVSPSSMIPCRCQDSCASTSTAIVVSRPCRRTAIDVRPMQASSRLRRPSASASSSAHDCVRIFVSSCGVPSASKRTLPSTMSQPSTRPRGPGQWTSTGRPAICDAIALSRRSLPLRSCRSAIHHVAAATSTASAVSFTTAASSGARAARSEVSARAARAYTRARPPE